MSDSHELMSAMQACRKKDLEGLELYWCYSLMYCLIEAKALLTLPQALLEPCFCLMCAWTTGATLQGLSVLRKD